MFVNNYLKQGHGLFISIVYNGSLLRKKTGASCIIKNIENTKKEG